jgi:long-chain acyl-CoA synthetase
VLYNRQFAQAGTAAAAEAGIPAQDVAGLGEGHDPFRTFITRQAEDLAVIFCTSGTSGTPKGAMLSHLNLVMNATVNAFDSNGLSADDVVMGALPLFHAFGQSAAMNASFRVGATLVPAVLELMVREGVTRFPGVPTMFIQRLRAAPAAARLPRLTSCTSGGAALPVAVLEEFERVFGTTIYEGYGPSETSPTATVNQRAFGTRPGTVGHPVWGVEAEIADAAVLERIELLPPGETGDIGTKDADGFVTIVDRRKDLIIRGGFNVYPREVEEVLARHPDVGQVAVIGVPDAERGEEICAVVVPRPGHSIDVDALLAWGRENLARHKYPRLVRVAPELPVGPSQKVLKRELRRRFAPQS